MIWYNQGTHIKLDGVHILCDPSFTTDEHPEYEAYLEIRKKNPINPDYNDVDIILVSHAHADHCDRLDYFSKSKVKVLAHPMTMSLKSSLFTNLSNKTMMNSGDTIEFGGLKISAYNSGHCGGSLMFLIEGETKKILFTGDLNTQVTVSTYPARPIECDVVVMEATFGDPKFIFPPRDQVYGDIYKYLNDTFATKDVIIMFCQSLGKVQDIAKLIRNFKENDIRIAMDSYSYSCTRMYDQYYDKINNEINHFGDDINELPKQSYIQISELFNPKRKTLVMHSMIKDKIIDDISNISRTYGLHEPPIVLLSGLSEDILRPIIDMHNPAIFQVSNHSDYQELINFAKLCFASKVCVFHGSAKTFKVEASKELEATVYNLHEESCPISDD